jgi:hypothetical protein
MLSNHYPADELADIRARIRELKQAEKVLRDQFTKGVLGFDGSAHVVELRYSKRRVFLRDRLPASILNDPTYWETRTTKSVVVREVAAVQSPTALKIHRPLEMQARAVRPGDPVVHRQPARPLQLVPEDDFDVIEVFAAE